ncbi:MAG: hypothetical protein ACHQQ3_01560 [Gemmatimonadales bacterium]
MPKTNLARVGPTPAPQSAPSRGVVRPLAPRPAGNRAAAARDGTRKQLILAFLLAPLVAINLVGAPYYFATLPERVRHPMHAWLRPSGYIGQSAGIAALLIFVFLWLYPLRKKWKALAFTGSIGRWLDVHVTAALTLPLLLAIHAAWRSDGVIGLGFVAMLVVCASGVVGRYLYTRIPRAKSGVESTREEVSAERRELIERLAATTGLEPSDVARTLDVAPAGSENASPARVLWMLLTNDVMRWRRTRELRRRWRSLAPANRPLSRPAIAEAVRLAGREISLTQQSRMLGATHRVFRYWHVAHRPFAVTALVAVAIHAIVVIAVGATWFR